MPIQVNEENGGKILVVHISGKVVKTDYEHFVPEFERLVRQQGKLRVLFDMIDFHGWDAGARLSEVGGPTMAWPRNAATSSTWKAGYGDTFGPAFGNGGTAPPADCDI